MTVFRTVTEGDASFEISRSRFIGLVRRVRTEDEAAAILREIRAKYRDCTHVCHAYITDDGQRSSDDGEPSGTAGVPIADCIAQAGVRQTLVAVVRYFGGIKLGTGGLLRAYTRAATEALAAAGRYEVATCKVYTAEIAYAVYRKIEKRLPPSVYHILSVAYGETVCITAATTEEDAFVRDMTALTQGKCTLRPCGERTVEKPL